MPQYQLPEILRTPLQELCLNIKTLKLGAVGAFLAKALQPPDRLSVQNAIELLKIIGALDDMEELTPLGTFFDKTFNFWLVQHLEVVNREIMLGWICFVEVVLGLSQTFIIFC